MVSTRTVREAKAKAERKAARSALDRVTEAQNYARTLCFTTSKVVPQKTFSGVEGRGRLAGGAVCGAARRTYQPRVWRCFGCDGAGDRRLYACYRSLWLAWSVYRKKDLAMYALLV